MTYSSTRRELLKQFGGGLLVLLSLDEAGWPQESGAAHHRNSSGEDDLPKDVGAWLHIGANGTTVFTGKAEVGQNIRTSLAQAVADELRIDIRSLQFVMGDTSRTPFDLGTFGSRTTPTMAPRLRMMAATAREEMIAAAARYWSLSNDNLLVRDGFIYAKNSQRKISFAQIAGSVDWVKVIGRDDCLTPVAERQQSGQSVPKIDAGDFVNGKHRYSSDVTRPGMLYGRILRPASFDAKLVTLDDSSASKMGGVKVIRDGDFVGVVGPDELIAQNALDALHATWSEKAQISSSELFDYLRTHPTEGNEAPVSKPSNADSVEALASTYRVAYIAHVPLEPRAAVAEWNGSKLTVWTGSQRPFGIRSELAEQFKFPEQDVRVIVPDTGSAYGGKHSGECAIEAARLSKAAGKPVKLIWTREEEFTWAYFRPAGIIEVKASLTPEGRLASWDFVNYNSGPSGLPTPYGALESNIHFQPTEYPLRQGSYRGLAATANHFARESHIDELAISAGIEPLEFRLKNLRDERVRAVLEAATQNFGWSKVKPSAGRGYGLACGMEKGSVFACCAEIFVSSDRQIHVERVTEAFECGAIVNPEHLKNQVEGAVVMGIGGALFEAIDFSNGRILNPHLAKYRVPRFRDVPAIEVVLLDRKDRPSAGAGETPIMGIAPAIANALFQATGERIRSMPIGPTFQTTKS